MTAMLDRILLTPLRVIDVPGGPVMHGMKRTDPGFAGFGEAYFSCIDPGEVKGWKRHNQMTLNFVVPHGQVRVVVVDEAAVACRAFTLSASDTQDYGRLTIPPGLWVAFGGLGSSRSIMTNLASLLHDPAEADSVTLDRFPWSWSDGER